MKRTKQKEKQKMPKIELMQGDCLERMKYQMGVWT